MKDSFSLSQKRKHEHIQICKTQMIESVGACDFDRITLTPEALPNFDFKEVDTTQVFLNSKFSLPIFITGMTGGIKDGQFINNTLAQLAQKYKIPMGLGSQKMVLFDASCTPMFDLKKFYPDLFLIGNLGAVSFNYGISVDNVIEKLIKPFELNAFALHLNALQECIQPEGERNFSNLLQKIEYLVNKSPVPIIVKEVGSGISAQTFQVLMDLGVAAVDVGGRGGTSWSVIEGLRQKNQKNQERLGELFRNWGHTTVQSLISCVDVKQKTNAPIAITATGGIRNGLHVAKSIALGASMCGVGLPFFRAVLSPDETMTPFECVENELLFFQESLKISMFCSGAKTLQDLKDKI